MMEIRVLFIQRVEQYEGQNAPEALAVEDCFTRDDNPEYFEKEVQKQLEIVGTDVAGHAIITFEVPQDRIRQLCLGQHTLKCKIKDE